MCTLQGNNITISSLNISFQGLTPTSLPIAVYNVISPFNQSGSFQVTGDVWSSSIVTLPMTCTLPCQTCVSAASPNNCTSCYPNTYLNSANNACGLTCPPGTYGNSTSYTCASCNASCATCVSSTNCTSCNSPLYLYSTGNNFPTCVDPCPQGFYQNDTNLTCMPCYSYLCVTCTTSAAACTSCIAGFYTNNNSCQPCPALCTNCTSYTNCSACIDLPGVALFNN